MLRKCSQCLSCHVNYSLASMRPEHGCSGNEYKPYRTRKYASGFNEAGARMLRKCARYVNIKGYTVEPLQ